MSVEHVEVLVEDPSTEAALRVLLPGMLGTVSFDIHPHACKQDLLARLPDRLRGYSHWLPANWRVLVLVDRDDDECHALKADLERMAHAAGLSTRKRSRPDGWAVVTRLAIEELEAWFFGDWEAVAQAYPRVPMTIPAKARYRDPDAIAGGTCEALQRILQKAGYFAGGLRKIELAGTVAARMAPDRNQSRSFQVFREAICECTGA